MTARSLPTLLADLERRGDAFWLEIDDRGYDVLSHGPEWVQIRSFETDNAEPFWRMWAHITSPIRVVVS